MIALCVALAFASAAFALGFAVTADAQESGGTPQPTIQSDKEDYPPGGTVVLTGSNWQPGESVNIVVDDDGVDERDWQRDFTVTADENGDIRDEFQLPDWFVANYSVKATGAQSGVATTTFTDAPAKIEGKDSGGVNYRSTGGPLRDWDELEKIPMRLTFTETGTRTVIVTFSHTSNSGRRIPGIKDLVDWTAANSKVTSVNAQLTDTSGEEWAYTVVANLASGTNNSNPGYVEFKAILAAGSHDYPGGSLHINLSGDGTGTMQINPSDVIAANPDLVVDKTGPATAAPGSTIEYTLNYKNISTTDSATGAVITDILPSGVTFDSCSDSCTVTGNEVSWAIGNLAPNTGTDPNNQLSRTLRVTIPAGAANGTSYVNNTDILSADAEQDLGNCGAVDSDNNADNDNATCDNYDSLKTTVASNASPNAVNDSYNVDEDGTLNVADGSNDVLNNDTDPDNDTLTVTGNTQPANGSLTLNPNGSFDYTPDADFFGSDSFDYTVSDGKGGTDTATVTITVNPVNDTPTITPNIGDKTILEDTDTGDISFTVGDEESAAGDLTVSADSSDTDLIPNGNITLAGAGSANRTVKVTPSANRFGGPTTITLTVSDGTGPGSQSANETFDVDVTPVNDAPSFDVPANAPPVNEDASAQTVSNFASNRDVGPFETASQQITAFNVTNNSNPDLFSAGPAIDPDSGDLTYTPAANAFGTAEIKVKAQDDGGTANGGVDTSTEKTFTITVDSVNDDPNAVDDTANATENGPDVDINVLSNDSISPDTGETLSITEVTQPPTGEGSVAIIESGTKVRFTPHADFFGPTSFTYTISDGNGGTDTATVRVDVAATNDPPEISFTDPTGDTQTVDESVTQERTYSYTLDETDGPNSEVTESCGGATKIDTPAEPNSFKCVFPDGLNTHTVSVTADDGEASNNTATDSIEVTVENVKPDANDDTASANEEGPDVEIDVLDNDTDPANGPGETNDPLTITNLSGPPSGEGSVSIIESGTKVRFSPNPNFEGSSTSFEYTIVDGDGGTDTATVTVNLTPANDPPVIDSVVVTNTNPVEEGSPATIEVTATDPDTPSSALRYSFDCDNDGTFEKGPQASNTAECTYFDDGTYPVQVKVSDDADDSDTDSTNVTVVNVAPAATFEVDAAPSFSIDEGQNIGLSLTNVVDPGTLDTHEYRFDCGDGTFGDWGNSSTSSCQTTDEGQITVRGQVRDDDLGLSDIYTETVTVNNVPPNVDPPEPVRSGENQTSDEGENKSFDLGSFTDPGADGPWSVTVNWGDGNQSTFQVPESARLQDGSFDLSGQHLYDDNGEYDVTVTVTEDGPNAESGQASFKITVNNVNPTALLGNDGPIDENEPATVSFSQKADPSNADNSAGLRYAYNCDGSQFTTIPSYADLAGNGDSKGCFFADDGTYTVRGLIMDKDGGYNVYATEITVDNAGPTAKDRMGPAGEDGAYTTPEETEVQVVLEADNPGNDNLTFSVTNDPSNGTLSGTGTNLTYMPNQDFNGTDEFTFEVCDDDEPEPLCDEGTIQIIVTPINDAPVGTDDTKKTPEDTPLSISVASLTANDDTGAANEGGQSLNITDVSEPENGTVDLAGDQITFTPAQNYNGPASFKYTVCDNGEPTPECSVVKVEVLVTVTEVNDPPTAALDEITTDEDEEITFDPKTNDSTGPANESSQNLVVDSIASQPGHGTATLLASGPNAGQVSYTPDANFNGNDEFTYKVCDDGTTDGESAPECATGTVRVTVNPVNDDPTIQRNFELDPTIFEDRKTSALGFIVSDLDLTTGGQEVPTLVQQTGLGSLTVTGSSDRQPLVKDENIVLGGSGANRTVKVTPEPNRSGTAKITLSVDDGEGGTDEASFNLTVRPVNDKPSFANIGAVLSDEDEGNVVRKWAKQFNMGADDENGRDDDNDLQRLLKQDLVEFDLVPANMPNADNHLAFALAPTINNDGELRYRTKAEDFGTAAFEVKMKDNGSLNGDEGLDPQDIGVDVSDAARLTINVKATNDLPEITLDQDGARVVNEGSVHTYTYKITDDESVDDVTESCGSKAQLRQDPKANSFKCFFPDGPATSQVSVLAEAPSLDERSLDAASLTDRFSVSIKNVAPRVSISGPDKAEKGQTKTFKFRITDPGRDTFSFASGFPECGQGGKLVSKKLTGSSGVFECKFVKGPAKPDVAIRVKDSDGTLSNEATKRITVAAPEKDDSCAHRPNGAGTNNTHGDIDDGTDAGTSNTDVHNPCHGQSTTN